MRKMKFDSCTNFQGSYYESSCGLHYAHTLDCFLKKKKKKTHDIRSRNSKNALAATKAWIDTAGQYSHIPGNFRVSEA